jgi:hypothetical protein
MSDMDLTGSRGDHQPTLDQIIEDVRDPLIFAAITDVTEDQIRPRHVTARRRGRIGPHQS